MIYIEGTDQQIMDRIKSDYQSYLAEGDSHEEALESLIRLYDNYLIEGALGIIIPKEEE